MGFLESASLKYYDIWNIIMSLSLIYEIQNWKKESTVHSLNFIVQLHNGVSDTAWYYGRWNTVLRGVFRTQWNIYVGAFLRK